MRLTEHFTREELEFSETALRRGIDNRCPPELLDNLTLTAKGLERVRAALGGSPIHVTSGYRCADLNRHIGGADTSKHLVALAADFVAPAFGAPVDIAQHLARLGQGLDYDQLILEGRWVHIAFPAWPGAGKRELLTAHFGGGGVSYTKGIG